MSRRGQVGVVGPVRADLHALIADARALQAARPPRGGRRPRRRCLRPGRSCPCSAIGKAGCLCCGSLRARSTLTRSISRSDSTAGRAGRAANWMPKRCADGLGRPAPVGAGLDDDRRPAHGVTARVDLADASVRARPGRWLRRPRCAPFLRRVSVLPSRNARSARCPMATTIESASSTNSLPGTVTGSRRPSGPGSPKLAAQAFEP